ncbi:MAG: hypothetical protein NW241_12475 [Bacteroidia bacterium]|nr:hypothetical protein [Bacteroidia bacterium]
MSKSLIRILALGLLAAAVTGGAIGMWLYNKPHTNVADLKADAVLSAGELYAAYSADEAASNERYLNKTIEVRGKVAEILPGENGVVNVVLRDDGAMSGVICEFLAEEQMSIQGLSPGAEVTVRGLCSGLSFDVALNRCVLIQP